MYWPLAAAVYGTYMAKLIPQLIWQDSAQNCVMLISIAGLALLSRWRRCSCFTLHVLSRMCRAGSSPL